MDPFEVEVVKLVEETSGGCCEMAMGVLEAVGEKRVELPLDVLVVVEPLLLKARSIMPLLRALPSLKLLV